MGTKIYFDLICDYKPECKPGLIFSILLNRLPHCAKPRLRICEADGVR